MKAIFLTLMKVVVLPGVITVQTAHIPCQYYHGKSAGDPVKINALSVLEKKCNGCHRFRNPNKVFTEDNMDGFAQKIYTQVFVKERMPKGSRLSNLEKQRLIDWITTRVMVDGVYLIK